MIELTAEIVREFMDYKPRLGILVWKRRARHWFDEERHWKGWNKRFAGKEALGCVNNNGYKVGVIFGKIYLTHRVIWLWYTGEWPKQQIDHRNGETTNNRISNLRDVSASINHRNSKRYSSNKSGACGVHKRKDGYWSMSYYDNSGKYRSSSFKSKRKAIEERKKFQRETGGFTERHGT